jgi:hypothetical protein
MKIPAHTVLFLKTAVFEILRREKWYLFGDNSKDRSASAGLGSPNRLGLLGCVRRKRRENSAAA